MGIGYATSNRGACHLRGYTPAAEILGVPEKVDPYEYEGKGELTAQFQDLHAISDSFDICKFNAFAEGIEEYVLQYNGMTGRDVTEDELLEAGERVYTLERYYNNLNGFDAADDSLPARFLEDGIRGQGASEGEYCELDEMKEEYYDYRGWVDGVVPDEKLDELGIDLGPGTGVSGRHRCSGLERRLIADPFFTAVSVIVGDRSRSAPASRRGRAGSRRYTFRSVCSYDRFEIHRLTRRRRKTSLTRDKFATNESTPANALGSVVGSHGRRRVAGPRFGVGRWFRHFDLEPPPATETSTLSKLLQYSVACLPEVLIRTRSSTRSASVSISTLR